MEEIFVKVQSDIDSTEARRETVKEILSALDPKSRMMQVHLQKIHNPGADVKEICLASKEFIKDFREQFGKIASFVPQEQYYKFCDMWKFQSQMFVFATSLITFLESGTLLKQEDAELMLGHQIELENYLGGLTDLPKELSRLCMTAVTAGNFYTPVKIKAFMTELYNGFKLLNLKNDFLRKKFDGIKYDLKRIEEIVYDMSIRNLVPSDSMMS